MCCFMTEKKLTKREKFEMILALPEIAKNELFASTIKHEIELLDNKKTSGSTKLTAKQKENEEIKDVIVAVLEKNGTPMTVTQLMKTEELCEYSMNKLTALVTKLRKEHRIFRYVEKRVTYFRIPREDDVFED